MAQKFYMFAVRDRRADVFGHPIFVPAPGIALRSFEDQINNPDGPFHKHPEDYDLYQLGTYEDSNASFTSEQPKQMLVGLDCVKK